MSNKYAEFYIQQKVTIMDCAELQKKLLPKGKLWNIELPKEQQIQPGAIASLEAFGDFSIAPATVDWYWSTLDFGNRWAGDASAVYYGNLFLYNPNIFAIEMGTVQESWTGSGSNPNVLTWTLPGGASPAQYLIQPNSSVQVTVKYDLSGQVEAYKEYAYTIWATSWDFITGISTPIFSDDVTIIGEISG